MNDVKMRTLELAVEFSKRIPSFTATDVVEIAKQFYTYVETSQQEPAPKRGPKADKGNTPEIFR